MEGAGHSRHLVAVMPQTWTARLTVTPARDHGDHEENVFSEGKQEEVEVGEKMNGGEVDLNGNSKEA
ncbi:hypothetical protein MTO96_000536 [Rhipicephalus appendiculatus]